MECLWGLVLPGIRHFTLWTMHKGNIIINVYKLLSVGGVGERPDD